MNHLDRAQRSEAMFLVYCAENSIESAKPLFHSSPYDFVARIKGKWSTIQVKTVYPSQNGNRGPSIVVGLRHAGDCKGKKSLKPYKKGDFDYLFCVFGARKWLIPASVCSHIRSSLNLGKKVAKYEIHGEFASINF